MGIDSTRLYRLIGARLRARRLELKITQDQLAAQVDLGRASLANIEAGRQRTPVHVIYELCARLDLEMKTVLPEVEEVEDVPADSGHRLKVPIDQSPRARRYLDRMLPDQGG